MSVARESELIRRRGTIKAKLTSFTKYVNNVARDDESSTTQLKLRFDQITRDHDTFDQIQNELESLASEEMRGVREQERQEFDDAYYAIVAEAKVIIDANESRSVHSTPTIAASPLTSQNVDSNNIATTAYDLHTRLPPLNLPTFNGAFEDWPGFREAFISSVDQNPNVSKPQKLMYLRSCLSGQAAGKIESLGTTSENYAVAWDIIDNYYNDIQTVVNNRVRAIFELPACSKHSASSLGALVDAAEKHYNALEALKKPLTDVFPVYAITSKLDETTRVLWDERTEGSRLPTMRELLRFLHSRRKVLERSQPVKSGEIIRQRENTVQRGQPQISSSRTKPRVATAPIKSLSYVAQFNPTCDLCKDAHQTRLCERLLKASVNERANIIKAAGLCYNCLRSNHTVNECTGGTCRKCRGKHNTLLHRERKDTPEATPSTSVSLNASSTSQIILPTAIINVLDNEGKPHTCRALLDSGSQSHFMTEQLAKKLKITREQVHIPITGISAMTSAVKHSVVATIKSRVNKYTADVKFLLLPRITESLPSQRFAIGHGRIPQNICLADPKFNAPAEIDAILGTELFCRLLCTGQVGSSDNSIVFQKTKLGWIAWGGTPIGNTRGISCNISTTELRTQVEKFWTIEEGPTERNLSAEEQACENHYRENTRRDASGRYVVGLPFRDNASQLGESYSMALKRFHALEKSLARKDDVKQQYVDFMREYIALGHMSEVSSPTSSTGYYLPHHAVLKQSSLTTKLRVVFDGSAKSSSNLSLNQVLMVGPTIQDDLFSILVRFRSHAYVLKADIAKMYRQILVDSADRRYQRILWREEPRQPVKTYELNTVTYGTSPASFLATRTLHQLAQDESKEFPKASVILKEDFYVDDLLTGASTLAEAKQIRDELRQATNKAGLELRQWASNHSKLIEDLEERRETTHIRLDLDTAIKTLGIDWNAKTDCISYTVNKAGTTDHITKRVILSEIAQLFDPLGLLGPVIIQAKLLMQRLWQLEITWDESVPSDIHTAWQSFRSELPTIERVIFDRKVVSTPKHRIELHGFCDASEHAYGACIYLVSVKNNGPNTLGLVCAKSRVAPLKTQTLPRLELCAAVLLTRLFKTTANALRRIKISRAVFWSDSTITLHWINTAPHTLKTFVSHRVAEIQQITTPEQWRHVASEDNPADLISRGMSPSEFAENSFWRTGPIWLRESENQWPRNILDRIDVPERRPIQCLVSVIEPWGIFHKYSSLRTLKRVFAYLLRFIHNARGINKHTGELSVEELEKSMKVILKTTQRETLNDEIEALVAGKRLASGIAALSPFLDEEGILRVGGRLARAELPYERKHPALLPKSHPVTTLIIRECHYKTFHGGAQATLSRLREAFWPLNGRNAVKRITYGCVTCRRAKPATFRHQMGNLPMGRLDFKRPFLQTGVDYCGPIFIKEKRHRNRNRVKVYLAIFVCFAVKAVHIEVVSDLTTEAFLAALRRFTSRRGKCSDIYSDNATNFVGACNELNTLINSKSHNDNVTSNLADEGIRWHFIPPRSPHFGGLWEAAVKSLKHHMLRVIGDTLLTYEALLTYVAETEAILNSRPLTPLSSDPNDLRSLTPAHFLIGDSLTSVPEHDYREIPSGRLSSWQHVQQMKQHLWARWSKEYLHEQTVRKKWHLQKPAEIEIGTIVTIQEDNIPPMQWCLGRVVGLHPGADGVTRVVTVKTARGELKRSIRKLSPLPIDTHSEHAKRQSKL